MECSKLIETFLVSNEFEFVFAIDGEGYGLDALEGDYDHLVLVDSLDVALDAYEVAFDEPDFTAPELFYLTGTQVEHTVFALRSLGGFHETLHLVDGDDGISRRL